MALELRHPSLAEPHLQQLLLQPQVSLNPLQPPHHQPPHPPPPLLYLHLDLLPKEQDLSTVALASALVSAVLLLSLSLLRVSVHLVVCQVSSSALPFPNVN
jgi:hypothetical protein